jgi:hypothetical protein
MTKEQFIKIIEQHQEQEKRIDRLSELIDYDSPLVEFGWIMFDNVMREAFNEDQRDWISWWLYDRISFTTGEEYPYWGNDDVEHYVHTPEELWDLIQNYK